MTQQDVARERSAREQPIVVGVDGSPSSQRALRWAVEQARLVGASVEAMIAWQDPGIYGVGYGWAPVGFDTGAIAAAADKVLTDCLTELPANLVSAVPVRSRVVEGLPAQVLLDAAQAAQLLVVGSRGHGRVAGMLLGSVSQHCVQHAPCPVVVVPTVAAVAGGRGTTVDFGKRDQRVHEPVRAVGQLQ